MLHLHWSEWRSGQLLFLGAPIVLAAHCGPSISKRQIVAIIGSPDVGACPTTLGDGATYIVVPWARRARRKDSGPL
jgi:hypothetical protein